ncbi:MAG: metal ABC transporter permease [Bacteroidetes bacterium]|nr:metal ABC transporter permease [Bacteroidota bacterium]
MEMLSSNDGLNIILALLISWSCSILGVFLMLRKMVMVGDAITHSVLPGVVIAYLMGSGGENYIVLLGAAFFGVLTTVIIDFLFRKLKLQEDASIGLTFTWLFAVGVVLIAFFSDGNADIDQECVLFGELGLSFMDKIIWNGYVLGTKSIWMIGPMFLLILILVIKGFKGFQIISFQTDYAASKGIKVNKWHYLLMILVSLVTVLSFESVGAILVVGFLILPPATAYLLSSRLIRIHFISIGLATAGVLIGYLLAQWFDVSISPMIVLTLGFVFFLTFVIKMQNTKHLK